jgi:hypothetical protein
MRIPHPQGDTILRFWAACAGVPPEAFHGEGVSVVSWQTTRRRVLIYRGETDTVVLAPDPVAEALRRSLGPTVPPAVELARGPLGLRFLWRDLDFYLPEPRPRPVSPPQVRRLGPEHADLLRELHHACPDEDCKLGEVEIGHPVVLGFIEEGRILGAASYMFEAAHPIADIGVLVHPQTRRRGIARTLVGALCAPEYAAGRVIQYRTQEENIGSRLVAERIGFRLCLVEEGLETGPEAAA